MDPAPEWLLITDPLDVGYLTGFLGGDSAILLPILGSARPTIISDGRYETELRPFERLAAIRMRTESFAREAAAIVGPKATIAIQPEHLTLDEFEDYKRAFGARRLLRAGGLLRRMREVKDQTEIKAIRATVRLQEAALEAALPRITPGMTEIEAAALIEMEMKSRGASRMGFETIVATGGASALPHYRPGKTRINAKKVLLIDWGAVAGGYNADMCRTFAFGRWPAKMAEIYDIVLEAHELAASALAPGRTSLEIDAIAREHITRAGYGPEFNHGLGHGFGLANKENPRLNPLYAPLTLLPGHVVTIEPGIYLPGIGGVRIEDDYAVTERGATNLCRMPRSREWSTLG